MSSGVQGTGGDYGLQNLTSAQQQSAAIKALAAQVSGGDTSGLSHLQGATRKYQGREYVKKPTWKSTMAFNKAEATSYAQQKAVFQEQRAHKHHDRLLNAIQQQPPNLLAINRSIQFLRKQNLAGGLRIVDLLPVRHSGASSTQRIAATKQLKADLQTLINNHSQALGANTKYAQHMMARLDDIAAGMVSMDAIAQFRATDNGAFLGGLASTRATTQQALAQKTPATRSAEIQQFQQHGIGDWTDLTKVDWKVSAGGQGGVLLVYDKGTTNLLGVLKIDNKTKAGVAIGIGSLLQKVHAQTSAPLPFDAPMSQFITADTQGSHAESQLYVQLENLIKAQKAVETKPELKDKCDKYFQNLAEANGVTRYSAAKGIEFRDLPVPQRMELIASDQFAADLAGVGVLAPFFGMNDHCGLVRGNTNLQNLVLGDNGRLTILDFEGNRRHATSPGGQRIDAFGFDGAELLSGLNMLLADLGNYVNRRVDLDQMAKDVRESQVSDSVARNIQPFFDADKKLGMFPEPGVVSDLISDQEIKDFALRVASKLADKLVYLKDQAAVIGQAHDNEPTSALHGSGAATMAKVVAAIDAFDQGTPGGGLTALRGLAPPPRQSNAV